MIYNPKVEAPLGIEEADLRFILSIFQRIRIGALHAIDCGYAAPNRLIYKTIKRNGDLIFLLLSDTGELLSSCLAA